MRWKGLFDDLEAEFDAGLQAELVGEVAERTRREHALLRLVDRVRPAVGHELAVELRGGDAVRGRLSDVGADWLLLQEPGGREVLVPIAAVLGLTGLSDRSGSPGEEGVVEARLDVRRALRALARDRAGVAIGLADGRTLSGTIDRVGADHLELAEHAPGEARRRGAVRQVRLVPLDAVTAVRSG